MSSLTEENIAGCVSLAKIPFIKKEKEIRRFFVY